MAKYFELALGTPEGFQRNKFFPVEQKQQLTAALQAAANYPGVEPQDVYLSVYDYESDTPLSTSSDFSGMEKHGDFYMDFDSGAHDVDTLNRVKWEVDNVVEHLVDAGVQREHIRVYHSGGKGYHLTMPEGYVDVPDSRQRHVVYKQLANQLKKNLALEFLDTVVYDSRRVLRLDKTLNVKGNLQKVQIDGGLDVVTTPVQAIFRPEVPATVAPGPEPMKSVIRKEIEPFMLRILNSNPEKGKRQATAYTVALYLKGRGYTAEEAWPLLLHSSIELEVERKLSALQSAYGNDKKFGLNNNELITEHMTDDERMRYGVDDITSMLVPWGQVMQNTKKQIEDFKHKPLLSYGIDPIDTYLGKMQPGELVTVGGVSGIGKSEFVWNAAKANARAGIPVAFIGLEMGPEMYAMRSVRNRAGLDANRFKTMDLTDQEKAQVNSELESMQQENLPIYFFNPKYKLDINKLDKLVGEATEKYGIKLWVIDHLHYFPSTAGSDDTTTAVSNIVHGLKHMTLKYDIPIMLVSHYRKLHSGVSPSLNSFKDSIAIPQVSDTVIALNRDTTSADRNIQNRVEISVLKSRYGMSSAHFYADFNPKTGLYAASSDFAYGLNGTTFD